MQHHHNHNHNHNQNQKKPSVASAKHNVSLYITNPSQANNLDNESNLHFSDENVQRKLSSSSSSSYSASTPPKPTYLQHSEQRQYRQDYPTHGSTGVYHHHTPYEPQPIYDQPSNQKTNVYGQYSEQYPQGQEHLTSERWNANAASGTPTSEDDFIEVDGKYFYSSTSNLVEENSNCIEVDGKYYYERVTPNATSAHSVPNFRVAPPPPPPPPPPRPFERNGVDYTPPPRPINHPVPSGSIREKEEGTNNEDRNAPRKSHFRSRIGQLMLCLVAAGIATWTSQKAASSSADVTYQTFYTSLAYATAVYALVFALVSCLVACARRTRPPRYRVYIELLGDLAMVILWGVITQGLLDIPSLTGSAPSSNSLRAQSCSGTGNGAGAGVLSQISSVADDLVCALTWSECALGVLIFVVNLIQLMKTIMGARKL